jgi:hypothetical protein
MIASSSSFGAGQKLACAISLFALLLWAIPTLSQTSQGTILGVVKDASGGAMAGATVTITNTGTNDARTVTTGTDGEYRVPALQPGLYTVRVEAPGFKSLTVSAQNLVVGQEMVVNATMQIGSPEQAVTVTGEAPLVNTTNSSLGGLVNDQQIVDLPLNGRNYTDLVFIQPGVAPVLHPLGGGAGAVGNWFSSNGSPPRSNFFTLDGAPIGNAYNTGPNSEGNNAMGVDGIKEFKTITSMFGAEYGMNMGAQVVMVSKGGTNQFHGDAFAFIRNNHLDARGFFDPTPNLIGGQRNPRFQKTNFGAAAGGPIRRDKTFFFLVYEGLRLRQIDAIQDNISLPAACHNIVDANGTLYNDSAVANPSSGLPGDPTAAKGLPLTLGPGSWFPSGGTVNGTTITDPSGRPSARLADALPGQPAGTNLKACLGASIPAGLTAANLPVATAVLPWLAQVPFPNFPGGIFGVNTFFYPGETTEREDYSQLRIDHNISASDTFFARYTFDDVNEVVPFGNLVNSDTGTGFPQFNVDGKSRNNWLTLGENHIFSANTLNQVRLSYDRTNFSNWPKSLTTPYNPFGSFNSATLAPYWTFLTSAPETGSAFGIGPIALTYHIQGIYTLSDDVFYTKGKHAFKFGALINRYYEPTIMNKGTTGSFTAGNPLGQSVASQLAGLQGNPLIETPYSGAPIINGCNVAVNPACGGTLIDRNFVFNTFGFYGQDDFRATSRLTLNIGLRYEFMTVPYDTAGRNSTIPDLLTSTTYRIGPIIDNATYRNFSPRVGFAWDVFGNGKTSVRSGFGIYYDIANLGSIFTQNLAGVPPFGVQTTFIANPTQVIVLPLNSAANGLSAQALGRSLQMVDYNLKNPHSLQYNLTVEQQLPGGLGLSVSFVGNRGLNILTDEDGDPALPVNPGPYGPGNAPQYNIANGLAGCQANVLIPGAAGAAATPTFPVFTVTNPSPGNPNSPGPATGSNFPCKTNPYWGSTIFITAASETWYDALQISVNKRVSHGLSFQAGYTWSHALDTTAGQMFNTDCVNGSSAVGQVPQNLLLDKGNSCSDLTHSAHFSMLYHFPIMDSNNAAAKIVNGWWMGAVATIDSGFPYVPTISSGRSFDGIQIAQSPGDHVNLNTTSSTLTVNLPTSVGSTTTAPYTYNFIPYDPNTVSAAPFGTPQNWFNPLMFGINPLGTLGNAGRDILRGPGLGQLDLNIVKDTKAGFLGEAGSVQFRAEIFNLLNRPNFGFPNASSVYNTTITNATATSYPIYCPPGVFSHTGAGACNVAPGNSVYPGSASTTSVATPYGTIGQISNTVSSSRQIQLALKVIF